MAFYALGIDRQFLVDITPHVTPAAVIETAEKFRAVAPRFPAKFARLPVVPARGLSLRETFEPLGMTYAAPYDELANQITGTVGFVTASSMLFHMDRATLQMVFRNIHRLLKPGGCFLASSIFCGNRSMAPKFEDLAVFLTFRYSERFWESSYQIANGDVLQLAKSAGLSRGLLEETGFRVACLEAEPVGRRI